VFVTEGESPTWNVMIWADDLYNQAKQIVDAAKPARDRPINPTFLTDDVAMTPASDVVRQDQRFKAAAYCIGPAFVSSATVGLGDRFQS
jgi:hypothetical protein